MDRDKVVSKLEKLLALAQSPNPHEAKLATDKAAELMAAYNVEMAEIQAARGEVQKKAEIVKIDGLGPQVDRWEAALGFGVGKAFDCRAIVHRTANGWQTWFFGFAEDLHFAQYFWNFLRVSAKMESMKVRGRANQNAFLLSFTDVVVSRLKEMYSKKMEYSDCRALVVVKAGAVDDLVNETFPKLGKLSCPTPKGGSAAAYAKGRAYGNNIGLGRPVEGGQTRMIG